MAATIEPRRADDVFVDLQATSIDKLDEHHKIYRAANGPTVRAIAEFEPMGGVLLAFPGVVDATLGHLQRAPTGKRMFGVPDELIIRMQQNGTVHIFVMCSDKAAFDDEVVALQSRAQELALPFSPALMHCVLWDTDTFWTRDYGPWWAEEHTGELCIAKHVYTSLGTGAVGYVEGNEVNPERPRGGIFRPNDDYGAIAFSDFLTEPIRAWNHRRETPEIDAHNWYFTGLLDAGGDYMVNGEGVVASSYLVSRQAELPGSDTTEDRMQYIVEQMNRFLGITEYWVLTDPSGTYIGHIDCWAKFLSKTSVVVAESDDAQINDAYDAIAAFFEAQGMTVFRIRCPKINLLGSHGKHRTTAAYVNSLILNSFVYVPLSGAGFEEADEAALEVYRNALPNHTVVGILGKPEAPWYGTDAMHCRTHGVPKRAVDAWLRAGGAATSEAQPA